MANPSLAMIPSGYKATKLYSVLPADGVGDFDVTRASTATRVNENGLIETMGVNVPRLDYTDGGCPVLLTEPQSTNLVKWSEDFSNASWLKTDIAVLSNSTLSPDGNLTADKITIGNSNSLHRFFQVITTSFPKDYTFSIYVKKTVGQYFRIKETANTTNAYVDLSDGNVISPDGNLITEILDDYIKIMYSFTQGDATAVIQYLFVDNSGNETFLGDGISFIEVWGAELKTDNTSYIKTEGSTVTRNADAVKGAGDVTTLNSEEGVLYFEGSALANGGVGDREIGISDGTSANRLFIAFHNTANRIVYSLSVGGVGQVFAGYIDKNQTINQKIAFKWKLNDFALWIDGAEVLSDTSGSVPSENAFNQLHLGSPVTSANDFFGKTKDIRVYKTALTDAELIELTTI